MDVFFILVLIYYFIASACAIFSINNILHTWLDEKEAQRFRLEKLVAETTRYHKENVYR